MSWTFSCLAPLRPAAPAATSARFHRRSTAPRIESSHRAGSRRRAGSILAASTLLCAFGAAAQDYVPDEVIVKFEPGSFTSERAEVRAAAGAVSVRRLGLIDAEVWRLPARSSLRSVMAQVSRDRRIRYIEPNYRVTAAGKMPDDPRFSEQWGLANDGQTGGTSGADIDALAGWESTSGSELLVAVIDSGVDFTHPDLAANLYRNPGEIPNNRLDDDQNGFVDDWRGWDFANRDNDPSDDNGHGTHVTGTIAAVGNNGIGVTGVAWRARVLPIKYLTRAGGGTIERAIEAIEYSIRMRARVANHSWGCLCESEALREAMAAAQAAGQLVVAAAGNVGGDLDGDWNFIPAEFDLDAVLAVAGTDHRDQRYTLSNFGRVSVDLGAPGVDILSTWPGGGYEMATGTSMATPHVSGAALLVWGRNPDLSAREVKQLLLSTVDPLPALAGRTVTGGRLNLRRALAAVPPPPAALAMVNAASWGVAGGEPPQRVLASAPGGLVAAFGDDLAPVGVAAGEPCALSLGGRQVLVRDARGVERPSCLLFVSRNQVNFQVPALAASDAAAPARVRVAEANSGRTVAAADLPLAALSPGVFTRDGSGRGLAAANVLRVRGGRQTWEPITQPIDLGPEGDVVYLVLYATGLRGVARADQLAVTIGGIAGLVEHAAPSAGLTGVEQINVRLPRALAAVHGTVGVVLRVSGGDARPSIANTVTVVFR